MRINKVEIELVVGDITHQPDITAIVNAANAELKIGGGVAGAIHRTAGPELARECQQYAPIKPGEAVITRAYGLPNDYVIHCLGPVYGVDHPESTLLANCYQNSLKLAEENNIDSIAFPAISTGVFGYPIEEATEVVFSVINRINQTLVNLRKIRFVLYSQSDFEVYQRRFQNVPRGNHE
jgi:O-acetyl-ADP-ribose deacetylase (regulator of RNase III)